MPFNPKQTKVITSTFDRAQELAAKRIPVAIATIVRGKNVGAKLLVLPSGRSGTLGTNVLDDAAEEIAREMLGNEKSGVRVLELADEGVEIFFDVYPPAPQLIIFGAVHVAQALVTFARPLGYRIIVIDARRSLATRERFPDVDELIVEWPDEALKHLEITPSTDIAILTHDPKFDEPAILGSLATEARYIGAVGSRKTNAERRQRMIDGGVSPENMDRVRGPIGLDIGGSTPEEMAISILAEMIAVRHGRSGGSLRKGSGSIRADS